MICHLCRVDKDDVVAPGRPCDACRSKTLAQINIVKIMALCDNPHWTMDRRDRIRELANETKLLLSSS